MAKFRVQRVNNLLFKELTNLIDNVVKDERVGQVAIYITGVETTQDLKSAKVYVKIEADDEDQRKDALRGLKSAAGFLRNEIGKTLNTYNTPELKFILDTSEEYGNHIDSILEKLRDTNQISETVSEDLEMD